MGSCKAASVPKELDMAWTGSETLNKVALRAFRSPVSGLATMLAAIASDTGASLAATYLVGRDPSSAVEMLASGGRTAGDLGPPGRVPRATATSIRELVPAASNTNGCEGLQTVQPWSGYEHSLAIAIILDGTDVCLLSLAGEVPFDAEAVYESSAVIGLLTQMVVHKREVERLRQDLHALRQDRSLLAAGLHHDLKGPLTSILGSARTLIIHDEQVDDETRLRLLETISDQSERLARMLTETLAKQAADPNAPVRRLKTSLPDLLARVGTSAESSRGGNVIIESQPCSIVTDADRLERAMLNLVDNALKYSPPDVPVHVIVEEDGSTVSITVADNGPGVSADVLPGLFSAYATDPQRTDGTGLGLHSVRALVGELGGRVGYSRHSDWTRFTVTLPRGEDV
jgi:signal transduction histidine kinase